MWQLWGIFSIIIIVGLYADVVLAKAQYAQANHRPHAYMVIAWIFLAVFFGLLVHFSLGYESTLKFFTGYILELSLSVDNLFVFMTIFSYFHIVNKAQQKALTYGMVGAMGMRMIFVFTGITLLNKFKWLIHVFGVMLIVSAIGMFKSEKQRNDTSNLLTKMKTFLKIKHSEDDLAFFTKCGNKWYATPLLACVITIEIVDIIFAVDSVPAVLSITKTPILVYSSNVFAIIGLRSLYICLTQLIDKFHLLQYGIAVNLIFVGTNMIFSEVYHIPTVVNTIAIISIFLATMAISCLTMKQRH
ncbi:MAG: TerC/Alx family metal homeostasis membrane protein [Puniceicoccales bacterium]|jgi:tellurite resistance protein TerC|nr:TerC/Alx family metal homeostasis membrane protein [Puniceicoccales bacterium]